MNAQRLRAAQALTGTLFGLFLVVHLLNQMVAVRGAVAYDGVQGTLRAAYQAPAVEVLLVLAPLLAHAGLALRAMWLRRGARTPSPTGLARVHRWSGRVLLLFFVGHVVATRAPAVLSNAAPGFAGVAFTLKWAPLWFWPYYAALALAGWFHLLYGLGTALPQLGLLPAGRLPGRGTILAVFALGAALLLAGLAGFGRAETAVLQSKYARWYLDR
jgi:succinate dehydrogenase/fumarate reductase cytochrome b subunit